MRHGGQLLIESLINLGVCKSFGVPGESYLAALDALHDTAGTLDYVLCRHEGGAAFMAAAYGKLTGQPGICFVTRGPGATNAAIGVHTAMQDSAPMLLFVGQVGTDMRGREAFQELDYRAVFGSMAKWVIEIDDLSRLPELLSRAWSTAISGRPGPVVVALPEDMLSCQSEIASLPQPMTSPHYGIPAEHEVEQISAMLQAANRPLILIGGCNWRAAGSAALKAFAEASDIPVVAAFRYQDQYDNFSNTYCGEAGVAMPSHVRALMRDADVLLAINVRFGEMTTDGYSLLSVPIPKQKLIHIHASPEELNKVYQPALAMVSEPSAFAQSLAPISGDWGSWRAQARSAYESSFDAPAQPSPVDMVVISRWLREHLPEDVIVTNGAGNFTIWPNKFLMYGEMARLLAPQSGAMGYGLPAAIAAKVAEPARMVVCFAGDGDFQMTCAELASAQQAKAQPIILLLNNGIYGTIRMHQERAYPERVSGTTMSGNPDFVAFAKAYGFYAERVENTVQFADAFARASASETGALLEIMVSAEAITPHTSLTHIREQAKQP